MELEKILNTSCILQDGAFKDKQQVLETISELVMKSPAAREVTKKQVLMALEDREELSSTGFGKCIAMPHCALDIKDFVFGVITIPAGIDFDAIDDKPVNIILFMIAPKTQRNQHIRYLSALSTMLSDDLNRTKILQAKSVEAIKGIFVRHTELVSDSKKSHSWNILNIYVQEEEILDSVLSILTGIDETNISVVDALSASHFLYSKPLFSSLWGTDQQEYSKIVFAIVPANRANEIIRYCDILIKEKYPEGLLITVQEVHYINGALNI